MMTIRNPETALLVHGLLEWLALAAGAWLYRRERRQRQQGSLLQGEGFRLAVGCLLGAAVGNKLVFWIEQPQLAAQVTHPLHYLAAGQSIVGGLLGGWIGVELAKRAAGITVRTGDDFVAPILLGVVIGRLGCFLAGLYDDTYGVPTGLPWGVDFGDGIPRHPTQLYEMLLALGALWAWQRWRPALAAEPGRGFRLLMAGYLLWRLAVDGIKPVPYAYAWGWSGIQWVCACGLLVMAALAWRDARRCAAGTAHFAQKGNHS